MSSAFNLGLGPLRSLGNCVLGGSQHSRTDPLELSWSGRRPVSGVA